MVSSRYVQSFKSPSAVDFSLLLTLIFRAVSIRRASGRAELRLQESSTPMLLPRFHPGRRLPFRAVQ